MPKQRGLVQAFLAAAFDAFTQGALAQLVAAEEPETSDQTLDATETVN